MQILKTMKRILITGLLSFLSYILYVVFIMAPIIRVPFIAGNELIKGLLVIPTFLIIFILPFIITYSMLRYNDYVNSKMIKNITKEFILYFIFHIGYIYIYENGFKTDSKNFVSDSLVTVVGVFLFFIFHVLFMTYILKTSWIQKIVSTKK